MEQVNGSGMEEPPKFDDPALQALFDQLQAAERANAEKAVFIGRTYNRMLDPAHITTGYIQHVINMLLPPNSEARMRCDLEWQERMKATLDALEKECKSNQFADNFKPKLWKPGGE